MIAENQSFLEVPSNSEAEFGLLGCVLLGAFDDAVRLGCSVDAFHDIRAKGIWEACEKLAERGDEVNTVNVSSLWQEDFALVADLPDRGPSASNVGRWWRDVWEAMVRRKAWEVHRGALDDIAGGAPVEQILSSMEEALYKTSTTGKLRDQKQAKREFIELIESAHPNGLPQKGPRVGLADVDDIYRGFKPGSMNTLAARPGCGKTAMAVQVALKQAELGTKVVVYSFEMSFNEMFGRLIANHSGEDLGYYFETGRADVRKITASTMECCKLPLTIEDNADMTIEGLRQSMRLQAKEGAGLFIVDYLQLIRVGRRYDKRVDEVSAVTRGLKRAFMETSVPGLVLAQMNRQIEGRSGKPQLSDLRESGSIEQDSDTVAFLHRDNSDDPVTDNLLEYIVRKNRHGAVGSKTLHWAKYCGRFNCTTQEP